MDDHPSFRATARVLLEAEGFDVVGGQVRDPRPWEALLNDNLWHELTHMYLAGYIVAGFIVAGVYSYAWLRGRRDRYHRTALVVALSFACLAAPVQVIIGDWAGRSIDELSSMTAYELLEQAPGECLQVVLDYV